MILDCKTQNCPYVQLIKDAEDPDLIHKICEICFSFVSGSETICAPDGNIQTASYFEIEANSEEERNKKFQCLSERFCEENTTMFKKRTDSNPIVEWELTPDIVFGLNSCVQKLESHDDEFFGIVIPILDAQQKDASEFHKLSYSINEVWNVFISHRLRRYRQIVYKNEFSLKDTFEEIDEMTENNEAAYWAVKTWKENQIGGDRK